MESEDFSSLQQGKNTVVQFSAPAIGIGGQGDSANPSPATSSASGIFSWKKSLRIPQASGEVGGQSQTGSGVTSSFARLTSGLGLSLSASTSMADGNTSADTATGQAGVFNSLTKGLVGSSRNAVKAMQVKARHLVSQNKRRYQVAFHLICNPKVYYGGSFCRKIRLQPLT